MSDELFSDLAREDFAKVRKREILIKVMNLLHPEKISLLSLDQIRNLLKPKKEEYRGMQTVPISKIVGSEDRYKDFNRMFLPKHNYMKNRWTSIDRAHLRNFILPPVSLYEIGGVYFVRDGNHRVSVAAVRGVMEIDAEVVSLSTEISLDPGMTIDNLTRKVIEWEQKIFYTAAGFSAFQNGAEIRFTSPGRFDELAGIINESRVEWEKKHHGRLSFQMAANRWYHESYIPVTDIITAGELLRLFPGRTKSDLYVWIVRHRDLLKKKYGRTVSIR
ncbi:MAG: transcriptional regulator, partial [Spirochaetales bacterium]